VTGVIGWRCRYEAAREPSVASCSSRNVREGTDVDRSEIRDGIIGAVCRDAARA